MPHDEVPRRKLVISIIGTQTGHSNLSEALIDNDFVVSTDHSLSDAIVVDLTSTHSKNITDLIRQGRENAGGKPLAFITSSRGLSDDRLVSLAQNDSLVISTKFQKPLIRELQRLCVNSDIAHESSVRLRAVASLGSNSSLNLQHSESTSSLLVAPPGPDALRVNSELNNLHPTFCVMSRQQILISLENAVADKLFIVPDRNRRPTASLIKLIRRHSDISSTPIVIFEKSPTDRHRDYWASLGADLVINSENLNMGAAVAGHLARLQKTQRDIKSMLRHLSFTSAGEMSRLSSPRLFDTALAIRCDSGTPFCLGALRLTPHEENRNTHVFTEPSIYVALGCPSIDLVTRIAPDTLLISMPGADLAHARRRMRMLATLVLDLKFGPQDQPVTFSVETSITSSSQDIKTTQMIRSVMTNFQKTDDPGFAIA